MNSRGAGVIAAAAFYLVAAGAPLPARAAGGDSKPVVISTGKGNSWANVAELKKAAEAHDPKACSEYGDALVKGDEAAQDISKGLLFLQEAAAAGEASAAFRLGKIYDDGDVAPQDFAKALSFYAAAAKAGVAEAQYNLGVLYATGRGTKRDYVEGLAWLIVATKNGATGDGEQKTRDQLLKIRRSRDIAMAEQRAAEILKDPSAGVPATSAAAPKPLPAPAKVEVAPVQKPGAVAPMLPAFGPGSGGGLAPTPPPDLPAPAAPKTSPDAKAKS
jgi:hypothetical protein